jgi:ABC-type polysaccharide/polyol phosphate export permease
MDTLQPPLELLIRADDPPPGVWPALRDLRSHRELLVNLAFREIRVRYKQSVLGVAWAVVQPVVMMLVFTVVFSRFARLPSEGLPYPVFAYAALLPWTFFASSVANATGSVAGGASLIKKVYFPREVLPIAAIVTSGVDFAISAGVFAALLAYYRVDLTVHALYALPLLGLQVALMLGLALLLSAFNAYYRDVRYVLPMAMQVWLYATPVAWSMDMVPAHYRLLFATANPMAPIIDGFRAVILHGRPPEWTLLAAAAATTLLLLAGASRYFASVERNLADIV